MESLSKEGREFVELLTKTGKVDWKKGDDLGRTSLYLALEAGTSEIVEIIVQQQQETDYDYNAKANLGETLGHAAVRGNDMKCVEILAALDYNGWNLPDPLGTSPIKLALKEDRKEMVNFLLNSARRDATRSLVFWSASCP